ncbi:MAG: sporulation transcription factor Spo0A [Firmicutes bacterium]|nr:sporulation transcription factor Spo0A [Bacillota bacterium]
MKTRIMIVDDNLEYLKQVKDYFENSSTIDVAFTACNGQEALNILKNNRLDVMVLDLVMPIIDGFGVLEQMEKNSCKVIIASMLNQDIFVAKSINLGADYYLLKPFNLSVLEEKIIEQTKKVSHKLTRPNRTADEKITNIFITVGIPAHIKGYQFLREAIKLAIDNPDIINSITKRLYPTVAERFSTSPSKVERAIRHAIEVAWNRGKIENINTLFGVRVYSHNEKPTNGEFIALVADKMLLESV